MKCLLTMALVFAALPLVAAEKVYELRVYRANEGKLDALNTRFRDHSMKLLQKHGLNVLGVWTPVEAADRRIVMLLEHKDVGAAKENWKAFADDADLKKLIAEGKGQGGLVENQWSFFLTATDFSPKVEPKVNNAVRVFELRTYIATPKNLDNLQARFRDHTVKLFEKHGMRNLAYWTLADDKPTIESLLGACAAKGQEKADAKGEDAARPVALVYMLWHNSQDAAKKSFDAFRKDPDWNAARTASEQKGGGSLTVKDGVKSLFLKPTNYSPMK